MEIFFGSMGWWEIGVLTVSAVLIGINKTGMPGIGVLPVIFLTMVFPARFSTGLQLIMLCAADVMAVLYYRSKGNWRIVLRLLPCAVAGLGLGSLALHCFGDGDDRHLKLAIGVIILAMAAINFWREHRMNSDRIPSHWAFTVAVGVLAGFTTQVANAAGPVMAIYLLSMRLPKEEYMGTCVWYFLIVNWLKMPLFIWEGRITVDALLADLPMLPFLALGAVIGILFVRKAPQKLFENIIQILVVLSAGKLLWDAW